jgi:hypothetical protein
MNLLGNEGGPMMPVSVTDIYAVLRENPQSLANSAVGSFADFGLFEGQAGGSPRERLIHLYHACIEPFLRDSSNQADKMWASCIETAKIAMAGNAHHLIEIAAAADFVREVLMQVSEGRFQPSNIQLHAAIAFVVVVGRAVKSAPWSNAVVEADIKNRDVGKTEDHEDDCRR